MVKRFVGVLIDLSKALNSVEHSLIISKSNLSPITLGMPQGSILGPLVFLCYLIGLTVT